MTLASAGYLEVDQARAAGRHRAARRVGAVHARGRTRASTTCRARRTCGSRSPPSRSSATAASSRAATARCGLPELRKEEDRKRAAGISPHPEIIQRHQMFAFPVACLVFAVIGLALGVHSRKEGKLGGFTLGLGVLFAYYGIMVFFEDMTKGGRFPAEWSRWMPNIIVGVVGLLALRWRTRAVGGGVAIRVPGVPRRDRSGHRRAVTVLEAGLPHRRRHPGAGRATSPPAAARSLRRAGAISNVVALSFAGLLGLYYIGTVIDKSERLFKGTADGWMLRVVPLLLDAAVSRLRRAHGDSLRRAGHGRRHDADRRAGRHALVRRQSLPGGRSAPRPRARLERRAVPPRRPCARESKPARRGARSADSWRAATPQTFRSRRPPTGSSTRAAASTTTRSSRRRGILHGVSIFEPARTFVRAHEPHVGRARRRSPRASWRAERGWVQKFAANNRATQESFKLAAAWISTRRTASPALQNQDTEMMTFGELRQHINERATQGQAVVAPRLDASGTRGVSDGRSRHDDSRACRSVRAPGRRGSLYGIGLALIMGVGYWLLNTFFLAVGRGGPHAGRCSPPGPPTSCSSRSRRT